MWEKRKLDGSPLPPEGFGSWLVYLVELVEKHRYERPMPFPPGLTRDEIRAAITAEFAELLLVAGLGEGRACVEGLYTPEERAIRLGADARKARLEAKLSRMALSEKTGVPAPAIARFETAGKISLERLLSISAALGIQLR
jgi:hypothetical protein